MSNRTVLFFVCAGVLATLVSFLYVANAPSPNMSAPQTPLYWVAPMDANYRRDAPGKSPMGMDLVPVYENNVTAAKGTVVISAQVENQLAVSTTKVVFGKLKKTLQAAGFLQHDESSVQHYHSRTNGWIEKLYVYSVGDKVEKNQKLYDLYSPELVYAQEEFIGALNTANQPLLQSSRLKLTSLGVSDNQIKYLEKHKNVKQALTFYAKKSGYISDFNVREGMYIQPQNEILTTKNLSSIWVISEVPETQSAWLEPNVLVNIRVSAFPGKTWQGRVDYIYPNINATNRTQPFKVVLENTDLMLKPNMFATLEINIAEKNKQLLIPSQAVIRTGVNNRVVVALGDGQYRSVIVSIGSESNNMTQVLTGLTVGQHIVTSSQFLIDSESNIDAELNRIDQPKRSSIDRVWAQGTVKKITSNAITLFHQPIKKWQWPAMNMTLPIALNINTETLKEGDNISFCLDKFENNDYIISHIEIHNTHNAHQEIKKSSSPNTMVTP